MTETSPTSEDEPVLNKDKTPEPKDAQTGDASYNPWLAIPEEERPNDWEDYGSA